MLALMQSNVKVMTAAECMVTAPCDSDGVLVVAVSEEAGSGALCLTITHRPTGRRLGCSMPADKYAFERAQQWRDKLLECGLDWAHVQHGKTELEERVKNEICAVFAQMLDYVEGREGWEE